MATLLRRLRLKRVSLVDAPANEAARVVLFKSEAEKAVWTAAFINNLPDASFAYIESGGEKDEDGRTKPRSLRHLPYKDASGKVDLPHLRNALARLPQTNIPAAAKAAAQKKLRAAAEAAGVGKEEDGMEDTTKAQPDAKDVNVDGFARCKKCEHGMSKEDFEKAKGKCPECGAPMDEENVVGKAAEGRPKEDEVDEKLKADLAEAQATVKRLEDENAALKKRLDTPEEIEKRKLEALPEAVRKQLTEQAEEITKMRSEKAEAEHIEKVRKEMPNVPGKTEDVGRLLKRAKDALKAEDFEALVTMLKAASAQIEKSGLFKEFGRDKGDSTGEESPFDKANRLAAEIISKHAGTSPNDAMAQVFREHPELYAAYGRSVTAGLNAAE